MQCSLRDLAVDQAQRVVRVAPHRGAIGERELADLAVGEPAGEPGPFELAGREDLPGLRLRSRPSDISEREWGWLLKTGRTLAREASPDTSWEWPSRKHCIGPSGWILWGMPRAAPKKAVPRPRKRAAAIPKAPPAPPKVSEAERAAARTAAHAALRKRLWNGPGAELDGGLLSHLVAGERPYWHFLTRALGASGPVLSLRVFQDKEAPGPAPWATSLLLSLAGRVAEGHLSTDTEQVLLLREGVAPGLGSDLAGVIFAPDPAVPAFVTPFEERPVLTVVPVTADEARAVREWSPSALVEVLEKVQPRLITELDRPSLLQSPRARQLIDQRMEKEGSSLSTITADSSQASKHDGLVTWKLSADRGRLAVRPAQGAHRAPAALQRGLRRQPGGSGQRGPSAGRVQEAGADAPPHPARRAAAAGPAQGRTGHLHLRPAAELRAHRGVSVLGLSRQ